jgi:hypothetical protein
MTEGQRLAQALAELRSAVWAILEPPLAKIAGWLSTDRRPW